MATQFPIVFEREASGVVSAYAAGLPVYAPGRHPGTGRAGDPPDVDSLSGGPSRHDLRSRSQSGDRPAPGRARQTRRRDSERGRLPGRENQSPQSREFAGEWTSGRAPTEGNRPRVVSN
jgi:hypothetical protein